MRRNELPGQWGNRTFPGPGQTEAPAPTREWNRHGSPTYQRSDPRNENAMDTETAGINKGNVRDYDNCETRAHQLKG